MDPNAKPCAVCIEDGRETAKPGCIWCGITNGKSPAGGNSLPQNWQPDDAEKITAPALSQARNVTKG